MFSIEPLQGQSVSWVEALAVNEHLTSLGPDHLKRFGLPYLLSVSMPQKEDPDSIQLNQQHYQ